MPLGSFRLNSISKFLAVGGGGPVLGAFGLYKVLDDANAFGTSFGDQFGYSVGISTDYTIIGAYTEDDTGLNSSGKVYIYSNATGSLVYTLNNPTAFGTGAGDQFGQAVAISNNYAIVGTPLEDDAGGNSSGKAYIYSTSTGSLLYTLDNPTAFGTSGSDQFGLAVSISDNYAIVGAYTEDDAGGSSSGKAYIYSTSTGSLVYTLNNPNPVGTSASDFFGWSVGISNNYAIVGANQEDDANFDSGKAYIYSTSTGSLVYTLDNPNAFGTTDTDQFGVSVAITDTHAIVGAHFEDDAGGGSSGKAYIYSTSTGSLLYTLDNPNAYDTTLGDQFGQAVALSSNYAIVAAPAEDDAQGLGSGKAYIYSLSTGSLLYTLDNPNAYGIASGDAFGNSSVGITDNYAIVGSRASSDAGGATSGKAYLYTTTEADHITAPAINGLSFVVANTSTTGLITIPASNQVGDIVILADTSATVTNTIPSGFTSISGVTTTGIRTNISYRILTAGQPGTTITGMAGTSRKVLLTFRDVGITSPTLTITTPFTQATTAVPTSRTIPAGAADAKSIYLVVGGATSITPTVSLVQTGFGTLGAGAISNSSTQCRYTVRDSGPNAIDQASVAVSMTDGGTNTLQCFRIDIT